MFLVYSAKRNGTEHGYSTVHCTCSLVHCNVFSNYSFTVLRSALLRETMMGTHLYFPSSNGAERNAFDSDGNIGISRAIQYFPFPLRSAPYQNHCYVNSSNGAERSAFDNDGNIAISLAIQYFPAPLRSVPIIHSLTERSGMLLTVMGTLEFL